MRTPNLAGVVAEVWDAERIEQVRRDRLQVTTLSRWRRARNGVWVNDGMRRPLGMSLRLLMLAGEPDK